MDIEIENTTTRRDADSGVDPAEELVELGLTRETVKALASGITASRLMHYRPGDTLFHEGTCVESLYIVRSGRIKLVNYLENGRARIVRLHGRGSLIGLNGLINEPNAHTAVAVSEVSLYQLPMHLLYLVKDQDPGIYCQLLEYTQVYLNTADTWITEFSTGTIPGRVARLVKFLAETDEESGPDKVTLLTVDEMADILGVTPESVSRCMAEMKRNGVLQAVGDDMTDHYSCDMKLLRMEAEK